MSSSSAVSDITTIPDPSTETTSTSVESEPSTTRSVDNPTSTETTTPATPSSQSPLPVESSGSSSTIRPPSATKTIELPMESSSLSSNPEPTTTQAPPAESATLPSEPDKTSDTPTTTTSSDPPPATTTDSPIPITTTNPPETITTTFDPPVVTTTKPPVTTSAIPSSSSKPPATTTAPPSETIRTTAPNTTTTTPAPKPTTTTQAPEISSTENVGRTTTTTKKASSVPVPVTKITTIGTQVVTITSTSYSIVAPTGISQGAGTVNNGATSSTNTGAIAGGVVGGVVGVALIAFAVFFFYRRTRKQNKNVPEDLFSDIYPTPVIGSSPGEGGSNARALVAPMRPTSKVGEDDPNMVYAPHVTPTSPTTDGYYEDTLPQHYGPQSPIGTRYPTHQHYYTPENYQGAGYWVEGPSSDEGGEGGGDYGRHVPDLVDGPASGNPSMTDVPHCRS